MGIDAAVFARLVDLSTRFQPDGRSLMLGRQKLNLLPRHRHACRRALRQAHVTDELKTFYQEDGYSETMFARLGFGSIEAMDMSAFEGANIVHDLNQPVDEALHGQFSLVIDGGTIEHVFNTPMALTNVFNMLSVGGVAVGINPLNNWIGHGLYQFGPDLVYSFWARSAGCEVMNCLGVPYRLSTNETVNFPDPGNSGRRLTKFAGPLTGRSYLYYEVRKTVESKLTFNVQQSDYAARWSKFEALQ